ncbi:MAG: copper-binding protein [Opitutaceae bacterium]
MKTPTVSFALALLAGSLFAVSQVSAHCGSCGVGDTASNEEHADKECSASCRMECCAKSEHADKECSASCEMECCAESGHALVGEVTNVMPDKRMVVVKHEEIEGVMAAMTMGFSVPESFDLSTLKKGDQIHARMVRDENGFLIKFITVVPPKA